MRKLFSLLLMTVLAGAANAADVDPAAALGAAKTHIAARSYAKAVSELTPAIEAAARIADPTQQKQALTALHFYAAVAYSGLKKDDDALAHLTEALTLSPNMRSLDPAKYDARFVALFERAKGETQGSSPGRFEELYAGFSATSPIDASAAPPEGPHPALEFLGTRSEKRQWHDATSLGDRTKILSEFWAARDQSPATPENEFRDMFTRRAAFADTAFASSGERGALSDRGRVFALLGAPSLVRRRALDSRDAVQAMSRGGQDIPVGTVEYWIYTRDQLPIQQPQPTVTFRFVSHQGVGTFVLQKDGLAVNTLTATANASLRD